MNTNRGATPLNDALWQAHSDIVSIIVSQPDIDYSVTTHDGETLTQLAVRRAGEKCVEILAAQEKCKSWNIPDKNGDTPILAAIKSNKIGFVRFLMKCPKVDLKTKDKKGSSPEDLARWLVNSKYSKFCHRLFLSRENGNQELLEIIPHTSNQSS